MIAKFTPALRDNTNYPLQKACFDFHAIVGFYRRRIVGYAGLKYGVYVGWLPLWQP